MKLILLFWVFKAINHVEERVLTGQQSFKVLIILRAIRLTLFRAQQRTSVLMLSGFYKVSTSAYRKPAFQPSAFRRLFIGFQPSAENQPVSMEKALDLKILQVFFKNRGENFSFLKNVEFLEFFGFTLCFRTFQAKNFFSKFFRLIEKFHHQFMQFIPYLNFFHGG